MTINTMKKSIYIPFLLLSMIVVAKDMAMAQARIARTEFLCYDKRDDAKRDVRTQIDKYIAVAPELQFQTDEGGVRAVYEQMITVPASWNDYNAYLHMESVGDDYTIFINGKQITPPIDRYTPSELFISSYLEQGDNTLAIVIVAEPYMATIAEDIEVKARKQFSNCYIFAQRKLGIYDVNVRLVPDSLERFAQLRLDVNVDNSFSTDEVIEVGYDIYAPDGKLMEYSVNKLEMEGFSRDTMRFTPWIYNSNPNRWSPANPKLYDLMLYTKRNGILWEYMPFKVGFAEYGYNEAGEITAFGKAVTLKKSAYDAAVDRATTEKEVKALKAKGINCLCPTHPQPQWFYDVCDKVGMYVIDCAAISSPTRSDDRTMSGTPANAPWLLEDYLKRVETMYRRAQNHVCIIAFRLANPSSGNGYNLYKAYELLKSFGDTRAIIYEGAEGEWNTDIE
jgi:beta-galactosidase